MPRSGQQVPYTMLPGTSSDTKPNGHELENGKTQGQNSRMHVWLTQLHSGDSFAFLKMKEETSQMCFPLLI